MTRIVFTSDLHVHAHRTESRDGGMDRLRDGLPALRQTLDYARQYQCPWVFGGDAKVPRRTWPHDALTGWLDALNEYRDVFKVLIPGNHDGFGEYGNGLSPFVGPSAAVVERPGVVDIPGVGPVAVLPHVPSGYDPAQLVQSTPPGVSCVIGHGMVEGCALGPDEFRADHGMTLDALGLTGPKPRFKVALFGDVHKGQMYSRGKWTPFVDVLPDTVDGPTVIRKASPWKGDVVYPGSPYAQTRGERNDGPKGCLLVDLGTGEVTFLPVTAPRYVDDEWEKQSDVPDEVSIVERWRGNFVRLTTGPWFKTSAHCMMLDTLVERAEPRNFTHEITPDVKSEQRTEMHAGMATGDLVRAWVTARPLDGVETEHVVSAGLALAGEVADA